MKTLTPPDLCEHLALIRDSIEGRIEDRRVIDQAIGEIRLKYALTREPAPDAIDALNGPMIFDRNVVATHRVEPAPCPHRELLRELREHASDTLCEKCEECGSSELRRRIDAALSQPCAAPG